MSCAKVYPTAANWRGWAASTAPHGDGAVERSRERIAREQTRAWREEDRPTLRTRVWRELRDEQWALMDLRERESNERDEW